MKNGTFLQACERRLVISVYVSMRARARKQNIAKHYLHISVGGSYAAAAQIQPTNRPNLAPHSVVSTLLTMVLFSIKGRKHSNLKGNSWLVSSAMMRNRPFQVNK